MYVYADTDFFLALLKPSDWLKERAKEIREQFADQITTSEVTFIELMLLCKRFNLEPVKITSAAMKIGHLDDPVLLKAALNIEKGGNVFDSFHAAHCEESIISSDDVFDKLFGLTRINLEPEER
ncbi:MAG TPA: PIN domain-containing protein [Candidatus Lokiarchaeia archaeon]|nr:PIN domain-containing protein [Candidatus Lokiarchaeia archaeon]